MFYVSFIYYHHNVLIISIYPCYPSVYRVFKQLYVKLVCLKPKKPTTESAEKEIVARRHRSCASCCCCCWCLLRLFGVLRMRRVCYQFQRSCMGVYIYVSVYSGHSHFHILRRKLFLVLHVDFLKISASEPGLHLPPFAVTVAVAASCTLQVATFTVSEHTGGTPEHTPPPFPAVLAKFVGPPVNG